MGSTRTGFNQGGYRATGNLEDDDDSDGDDIEGISDDDDDDGGDLMGSGEDDEGIDVDDDDEDDGGDGSDHNF